MTNVLPADVPDPVVAALGELQVAEDELKQATDDDTAARSSAVTASKVLGDAKTAYVSKKKALRDELEKAYPDPVA